MLQSMGRKESDVTDQLNNNSKLKLTSVLIWASQVTLGVKNPPTNAGDTETLFRSLGWEDPLEEGMATHSSILAWRIPWTDLEVAKSQTRLSDFHSLHSLYSQVASCLISSFSCDAGSIFSHWKVRR